MKRIFPFLLTVAVAVASLTACKDDDDSGITTFQSMVTVYSCTPNQSMFELIPPGSNNEPIYLTSHISFYEPYPNQGERMMILYQTEDNFLPVTHTSIKLLQAASAYTVPITKTDQADTLAWRTSGIYVNSLWQTGAYLNLDAAITDTSVEQMFELVLDNATLDDEYPTAYLLNKAAASSSGVMPNYQTYASFNLNSIWSNINGLKVCYKNFNNPGMSEMIIKK